MSVRYFSLISMVLLLVACGDDTQQSTGNSLEADSASMRVIDPEAVALEDQTVLDSIKLEIDSAVQTTGTPEVIDDGKESVEEPCNEVHRREIASKKNTIAELEEILAEQEDAETKADIQAEIDEMQADLTATIARHNCGG